MNESGTSKAYYVALAWNAESQSVKCLASGYTIEEAVAGLRPDGRPTRLFNVGGEDPGTPIVQWLAANGCGIQKANDLAAWIGKLLYGPQCDW